MCGVEHFTVQNNEALFRGHVAIECIHNVELAQHETDMWRRYFAALVALQLRRKGYETGEGRVALIEPPPGSQDIEAEVRMMALGPDAILPAFNYLRWPDVLAISRLTPKEPRSPQPHRGR